MLRMKFDQVADIVLGHPVSIQDGMAVPGTP
jgi:hypothetical protein